MWKSHLLNKINQFFKIDKWWIYKIGSGVFTFILFKTIFFENTEIVLDFSNLILFVILISLAIDGHFINDYSDYESDKVVGKNNIFNSIHFRLGPILIIFLSLGTLFLTAFYFSKIVVLFVVFQVLSSVVYSLKPFRIKERGVFALLLTGFYERMNPYIIILLCVAPEYTNTTLLLVLFYFIWSYLWECRNFMNGQLEDVKNDLLSNVKSFAIIVSQKQVVRLKLLLLIFELLTLFSWLFILVIIDVNYLYFLLVVITLQLIQVHGARKRYSKIEVVLDNCYSNIFMASFLIVLVIFGSLSPFVAIVLVLLFQYRVIVDLLDFSYYRIKHFLYYSYQAMLGLYNKNK